jgi:hypothetical protein
MHIAHHTMLGTLVASTHDSTRERLSGADADILNIVISNNVFAPELELELEFKFKFSTGRRCGHVVEISYS